MANASLLSFVSTPARAAVPDAPIEADADDVHLAEDPWLPLGQLTVRVRNTGPDPAEGHFVLYLPPTAKPEPAQGCTPADGPLQPTWICGGEVIAAGGSRTYQVGVRSTTFEPVFNINQQGWVEGKLLTGGHGGRDTFQLNWPTRLPLRLAATAGRPVDGHVDVRVRVTNPGSSPVGGYSLMVQTPTGVRVTSPACSDSGRMSGVGCEVYRGAQLSPGTTDSFTVRLATGAARSRVRLYLAPTNRYTNRDTEVSLRIGGSRTITAASETARPSDAAASPRTQHGVSRPMVDLSVAANVLIGLRKPGALLL
ncbi:MAG TPA: hypothetical protein VK453_09790 [Micromonosporaceae bacterium]|nr:hypothetical protein [Micromonosporaceae bacterium]